MFGTELRLDFSVVIIFGPIVDGLGIELLRVWHAELTTARMSSAAVAPRLLFFASGSPLHRADLLCWLRLYQWEDGRSP